MSIGDRHISYVSNGEAYWGENLYQDGSCQAQLWASDNHQSVIAWLGAQQPDINHQRYTPYGSSAEGCSIGFNGQWRDPVTGWYHLGNGYRVYNPVLMRFHAPDRWSPFTSGEINAYNYCAGDPINRVDPSGHKSRFRRWLIRAVFLLATIAMGFLTAGASVAIKIGVGIAVGVASHVVTGAVYDLATGETPTLASVANDAINGAIAGASKGKGTGKLGKRIEKGAKKAKKVKKEVEGVLEKRDEADGGADSTGVGDNDTEQTGTGVEHIATSDNQVVQFANVSQADEPGLHGLLSALAPELEAGGRANPAMAGNSSSNPTFTLFADYDATFENGRAVVDLLNREYRCYFGSLSPVKGIRQHVVDDEFDKSGSLKTQYRTLRDTIRKPNIMASADIGECGMKSDKYMTRGFESREPMGRG